MIAPHVLSWATDLDDKTAAQAARSAELPFVFDHVALMPDAHFGYGATVGSVIPTKGAIIPSAVGVDIGCGMIAAELDLSASDLPDDLAPLHAAIRRDVPAGVGRGHDSASEIPDLPATKGEKWWTDRLIKKAAAQFGSLGSGNHFIEVCLDERDRVLDRPALGFTAVSATSWRTIHIDGAKGLMQRYFIDLPDRDLAYLVEGTDEFDNYITDMLWAQEYAMGSASADDAARPRCLDRFLGREVAVADVINCHHNFTEREHHMGQTSGSPARAPSVPVTATVASSPARWAQRRSSSPVCGNDASFHSCSHGAGRRMSRGQARRELDEQTLVEAMAGKAWNNDAKTLIDEDPAPTRTSTRSWPHSPTSSPSITACTRSSTTREPDGRSVTRRPSAVT